MKGTMVAEKLTIKKYLKVKFSIKSNSVLEHFNHFILYVFTYGYIHVHSYMYI